jgi:hypothetical protein
MFRTFRSPIVLAATRCISGCTINWSGLDAPGVQSQSTSPPNVRREYEETSQTLEASPRRVRGDRRKPKG